jgi:hypothetical protein
MMNAGFLSDLAVQTIRSPAEAGRRVLDLRLSREVLWTALFLAVVLNTLLLSLQNLILPPLPGTPALFTAPGVYFAMVAGAQIVFIYALYLVGGWLGGRGCLLDVMSVIVWLNLLQVAFQAFLLFLLLLMPPLAGLLNFAAMLYGMYILLHFIDQAHGLNSVGRAAGVLVASLLVLGVALTLLLALAGGALIGPSYV